MPDAIWLEPVAIESELARTEPTMVRSAWAMRAIDAVVRGMLDHRSNAFVESMNGQLQQAKRAARGYRTAKNFIAIAYGP